MQANTWGRRLAFTGALLAAFGLLGCAGGNGMLIPVIQVEVIYKVQNNANASPGGTSAGTNPAAPAPANGTNGGSGNEQSGPSDQPTPPSPQVRSDVVLQDGTPYVPAGRDS